ncbi:MAG: MFS transporter permease [Desulfobacteraceae bacterium]|nr:MAG: MFS transporter permease [Desulfobacteraceae bacterium]
MIPENDLPQIVIPKEKALFWMDRFGRWHNDSGRFEHKGIIDYFNASICRDEGGYFVSQSREAVREKVYFYFEDTPLFVVDVRVDDPIELVLNTREKLNLSPQDLFVSKDHLYMRRDDERIKFTDRAMIKLSAQLEYEDGRYCFVSGGVRHILPDQ